MRTTLCVVIAALTLAGVGVAYLAIRGFTCYDNGRRIRCSFLEVCVRLLRGYGRKPIDERRLGPDWGLRADYVARNFTLNLVGLDYSLPLSWEDIVAGPGLWVIRPPSWTRWKEVALYPSGITIAPGERVTVRIHLVDEGGLAIAEHGAAFAKAYLLTLYRPRFSSVAYVIELKETEPGMLAISVTDPEGAERVVRRHLEATRDDDYEAWVSTLVEERKRADTEEAKGLHVEFGVISLTVEEVRVSVEETYRIRDMYFGSDLARRRGWSDEYISENMIVVFAQYTVDYDNTKVAYREGTIAQYFILVRDDTDSPWLIWDATSPTDVRPRHSRSNRRVLAHPPLLMDGRLLRHAQGSAASKCCTDTAATHGGVNEDPMAQNRRLSTRKVKEILRLRWGLGLGAREVARSCSVSHSTVSEVLTRAESAGLSWPLPDDLDEAALEAGLYPAPSQARGGKAMPDMEYIHEELRRKGVTLQLLWEEY